MQQMPGGRSHVIERLRQDRLRLARQHQESVEWEAAQRRQREEARLRPNAGTALAVPDGFQRLLARQREARRSKDELPSEQGEQPKPRTPTQRDETFSTSAAIANMQRRSNFLSSYFPNIRRLPLAG